MVFMEHAKDVMVLGTIKRQDDSQKEYKDALDGLRYDRLTDESFNFLNKFNLKNNEWTTTKVDAIINSGAMYAFSNNKDKDAKNMEMLIRTSSATNPVARVHCTYPVTKGNTGKPVNNHFRDIDKNNDSPRTALICVGAKVSVAGRNFHPRWGLFNGSVGTVAKIAYDKDKSPNNGDHPSYVVVDLPNYCGPAWDTENPTVSHLFVVCSCVLPYVFVS